MSKKKVMHVASHGLAAKEAAKLKLKKVDDLLWLVKASDTLSTTFPAVLATLGFKDGDTLTLTLSVLMFVLFSAVSVKLARKAENLKDGK